jgi:hypothetical protein
MTKYNYNVHNKFCENLSTGSKFRIDTHTHTHTHTHIREREHTVAEGSLYFFKKIKQANKNILISDTVFPSVSLTCVSFIL